MLLAAAGRVSIRYRPFDKPTANSRILRIFKYSSVPWLHQFGAISQQRKYFPPSDSASSLKLSGIFEFYADPYGFQHNLQGNLRRNSHRIHGWKSTWIFSTGAWEAFPKNQARKYTYILSISSPTIHLDLLHNKSQTHLSFLKIERINPPGLNTCPALKSSKIFSKI